MELAEETYRVTRAFPREEMFGLTSQARRAAASVAANIAEGYGRGSRPAYASFVRNAQGSLKELETHLILAERVGAAARTSPRRRSTRQMNSGACFEACSRSF
jgi:four helix bundle protein